MVLLNVILSDFRSYGEQKQGLDSAGESRPCFTGAFSFKEEEEEDVLLLHSLGKFSQGISLTMVAERGRVIKDIYLLLQKNLYFPRAVSELSYPSWVEVLLSAL